MIKFGFSVKSQMTKKFELLSQRTDSSTNMRYESLITVHYKYKEILLFAFWM